MSNNISTLPLTVTQLNNQVKSSLHRQYQNIDVVGEINNLKKYSSGHVYFVLKDKMSQISCVMFNSYYAQLNVDLNDGEKVVLSGDVTLYLQKGSYQFSAKKAQFFNQKGDIYKDYEKLKKKLEEEGLFKAEYKKTIPRFPSRIGIVTSLDGAVVKDIINIAKRRSKSVELILSDSSVQGVNASDEIISALNNIKKHNELDKIDIVIIARGGGAFEDLHCFNNEKLARKIFEFDIPVISAIGHETDFTILDFVADLRASTPSESAELSIPDDNETIQSLDLITNKILKAITFYINKNKTILNSLDGDLKEFNPKLVLENYKVRILNLKDKIITVQENICNNVGNKIQYYNKLLYHNNPYNILNKGFTVVYNSKNQLIKKVKDISLDDKINVKFYDGDAVATIQSKKYRDESKEN